MSHKKCPISDVFLESIHGMFLLFFASYINLVYVLNFKFECPKCHILIYTFLCEEHIFCESLLPCASFSLSSHGQCPLTHLIFWCATSSWFHLKYTFSCLNHIFPLISFSSCVSLITVSPAMPSTTSNTSSQMPSVNGWHLNNTTK